MEAGSIGKKSRRPKRTLEDDDSFTVDFDQFDVCEQNLGVVQLAILEYALTNGYTD